MTNKYINRLIEPEITQSLFKSKVILIYGPRRAGKTTLVTKLLTNQKIPVSYLNGDEGDTQRQLAQADTSHQLGQIIGNSKLIIIDEAQRIPNIGLKLKLLVDHYPDRQIIATGSSSFELANQTVEPLTGRNFPFWLFPLSVAEISTGLTKLEINRLLPDWLMYGNYPETIQSVGYDAKRNSCKLMASDYLYKDIYALGSLRNPELLRRLLEALALQIGNEVSYNELATLLGASKQTVSAYIDLLEKAFIVFRLNPFSRNLRKEIGKNRKIYFYDLGIRNAIIDNFNPLSLRNDIGALWENFLISEFQKKQNSISEKHRAYFWRTYDQKEIDYLEEKNGQFFGYEFKWQKVKYKPPQDFLTAYPKSTVQLINQDNYPDFIA